jgi:ABC-2 type transport system permease protein
MMDADLIHPQVETNNKINKTYSFRRFKAIMVKEFIQMRRDRLTLAMMMIIPLIQLILFGYAINNNPQHLPTVVVSADNSTFTRSIIQSVKNTGYLS